MPRPKRRSPRLEAYDYATEGAYFVTVCSLARRCIFGEVVDNEVRLNAAGEVVASEWREIGVRQVSVRLDVFVVMPNHLHGILWLRPPANTRSPTRPTRRTVPGAPACRPRRPSVHGGLHTA